MSVSTSYQLIIIGAGPSGLGCAKGLMEAGCTDFKIISEQLGGKIATSKTSRTNLGAHIVRKDGLLAQSYLTMGRKVRSQQVSFDVFGKAHTIFSFLKKMPFKTAKFAREVHKYSDKRNHLNSQMKILSQSEALNKAPELCVLFKQSSLDWLRAKKLLDLAPYLEPLLRTGFGTGLESISAFHLLDAWQIILYPFFEYELKHDKLENDFGSSVIRGRVNKLDREANGWTIQTESGNTYSSNKVVLAVNSVEAQNFSQLIPKIDPNIDVSCFHLKATAKHPFARRDWHLFSTGCAEIYFNRQVDGSFLLWSLDEQPQFEKYFSSWEIVEKKRWLGGYSIGAMTYAPDMGEGLYWLSDYNFKGIEDCYVSGLSLGKTMAHELSSESMSQLPKSA